MADQVSQTEGSIDGRALDSLSVAPSATASSGSEPGGDAGRDRSIDKRLQKNPDNADARLDAGLDESMDASDPPASTQPGRTEPAPSSGFDAAVEAERQRDA